MLEIRRKCVGIPLGSKGVAGSWKLEVGNKKLEISD